MSRPDSSAPASVCFDLEDRPASSFLWLLLAGVGVEVEAGFTVGDLLRRLSGLPADEAASLAATVVVDGHPVDDIEGCSVGDGSRIALSGPLPGLAGACLRRNGVLAPLRRSLGPPPPRPHATGVATVCLFNLVAPRLGPQLLAGGVLVKGDTLAAFLASRAAGFWRNVRAVRVDDHQVDPSGAAAVSRELPAGAVRLVVRCAERPIRPGREEAG